MAIDDGTDWEKIARWHLWHRGTSIKHALTERMSKVAYSVDNDGVTSEGVAQLRADLLDAIEWLEGDIAPLADGVEPWPNDYIPNAGVAREWLGVTSEQLREIDDGAAVEVGTTTISELTNGHTVQVETPAGIEVELQPTTNGETLTGP